ncbi:MAG: rRNA methyltransferase [Treponema sp.]|nr:rRNA methyltransferase [Treponema sp.]
MSGLFPPLAEESRSILDRLPRLIDETFPVPGRFRAAIPRNVAELSRLLTSERKERNASYLGKPALLSAYLRYFLPWNIYRLCRLLSSLPLELKPGGIVNDLGAGPLTLAAALWISRPDLRKLPLEFRCLDRTAAVLEAGKKFFAALSAADANRAGDCPWTINCIRGEIKANGALFSGNRAFHAEIKERPAALTAAANVYNELFWNFSPVDSGALRRFTEGQARLLNSLTESSGSILVLEPGIPRSGEFVSLLRSALMKHDRAPLSPCAHQCACPFPGGLKAVPGAKAAKSRWCHFAFDTADAPGELHRLSSAAGIPKERAVLSFLLAGPASADKNKVSSRKVPSEAEKIRIISDSFSVGRDWGRYGCSGQGLVLVCGSRRGMEGLPSGALEALPLSGAADEKSGALLARKD